MLVLKILGYIWASPVTFIGMLLALAARLTGGRIHYRNGIVEASGGIIARIMRGGRFFSGGAATTFGHVILARNEECLERSRRHEQFHVRQFAQWGVLLIPVYGILVIWLWCRGYHPYLDHPMEPPPDESE
jgi:hypothetical protein